MLRPALFMVAVLALVPSTRAAAPDLSGNWMLTLVGPSSESRVCILKVEAKDGKPSASVVFSPPNVETTVTDVRSSDSTVAVTVKQVRMLGGRPLTTEYAFVGVPGKDPKVILGSTGTDRIRTRARLTATDKEKLEANELTTRIAIPEPMTKAMQLSSKATVAQNNLFREKDAEKRKELQKELTAAVAELNEKQPGLYREVIEKHADSPAAYDAALNVLRSAVRGTAKLTPEDAAKFVKVLQDKAMPHGPLFAGIALAPIAEGLANQKGMEAVAVAAIEPAAKALTDDLPASAQSAVLNAYHTALTKAGKADQAKEIGTRIAKLEEKLDAEYLAKMPFKPTAFAGRKDKSANQVVMMEMFTGAQCPPCVAADIAFDGLIKAYKPTDLVLVQYHMHIPGSDPMTNPDTVARWDYYRKLFAEEVRGVPSTVFNGKVTGGGGGGMTAAERKFGEYTGVINPLLEKTTETKLAGKAKRTGDKLDITVEAVNGDGDDMKLRLLVVEETVKYAGSNGIRFHHQVVRAMPGGAGGVAVKDKSFKHSASVDLGDVRKSLTKYLDDYTADNPNRPFARPDRPMDMKDVRVIAMVQNDKTGEILQAVQIEVEGKPAAGGGQ
jgi:hypothetical protein